MNHIPESVFRGLHKETNNGFTVYSAKKPSQYAAWCRVMREIGGFGHPVSRLSGTDSTAARLERPEKPW